MLRNGEQLILAVVLPLLALVGLTVTPLLDGLGDSRINVAVPGHPRALRDVHGVHGPGHLDRIRPPLRRAALPVHHAAGAHRAHRRQDPRRPRRAVAAGPRGRRRCLLPRLAARSGRLAAGTGPAGAGRRRVHGPGPAGRRNGPARGHAGHHQPAVDPPRRPRRHRHPRAAAAAPGPGRRALAALRGARRKGCAMRSCTAPSMAPLSLSCCCGWFSPAQQPSVGSSGIEKYREHGFAPPPDRRPPGVTAAGHR